MRDLIHHACQGLDIGLPLGQLVAEVTANVYAGASSRKINGAILLVVRAHIEQEPALVFGAARRRLNQIYRETLSEPVTFHQTQVVHQHCLLPIVTLVFKLTG